MMRSYLIACIVVLCACLVLGKPAPSATKQDISKSINRLIDDLRLHKAAETEDEKELIKIVQAFSAKLRELQEGIQRIDEAKPQEAQNDAKRADVSHGSPTSTAKEGSSPHVIQQIVVKAPEDTDIPSPKPQKDNVEFVRLLLTALEKLNIKKEEGKTNRGKGKKPSSKKAPKGTKKVPNVAKKEVKKGSDGGDFLERLDKRGQYYDAELNDGFDMFKKKRNQKQSVSDQIQDLLDLLKAKSGK